MDVRLLAFDLDGTFLAPDKSVTPRARRAVELLRERGIEPVPTTGRVYQTLFDRVLGMDGFRYAIAANGAVVLDVEGGRFLRRRGIEAPVAEGLGLWHAASEAGNIEIAPAGASKASGLATLCSKLGIPLAQVCAIGDGGNDAAMLREAGLGVAMGNAIPEALAAADEVAPTNAEDGFADFVERRLLG